MLHRSERLALLALVSLGAISAVAGAIGLLGGGITFPDEWLAGSPFRSYTGPALILGLAVGGSQVMALAGILRHRTWAATSAALAGVILIGWIGGEVLIVGTKTGLMAALQILCFLNGLLEVTVVGLQHRAARFVA